jgi:predicted RNase H-like nuclease (RuvC/YqgF family)
MDRSNISTLYSNNIFEQVGGKTKTYGNTIESYTPSDKSLKEQSSIEKLMKANRELKRDLDKKEDEHKKVKKELERVKSKLNMYSK